MLKIMKKKKPDLTEGTAREQLLHVYNITAYLEPSSSISFC